MLLNGDQPLAVGREPHRTPAGGVAELGDGPRAQVAHHEHVEAAEAVARIGALLHPRHGIAAHRVWRTRDGAEPVQGRDRSAGVPHQLRAIREAIARRDQRIVGFPLGREIVRPVAWLRAHVGHRGDRAGRCRRAHAVLQRRHSAVVQRTRTESGGPLQRPRECHGHERSLGGGQQRTIPDVGTKLFARRANEMVAVHILVWHGIAERAGENRVVAGHRAT